jgi:phosphohistidine phosphatase
MITLSLLRHGKSDWDDAALDDFHRPLARRGREAAPRIGAYMAAKGRTPELILCSPAVRARQTLDLILPLLSGEPTVDYEEALYLAAPLVLLNRVRKIKSNVRHLMIVGHNPGMHGLAVDLAGTGNGQQLRAMSAKFPTTALAVIVFDVRHWAEISPAAGQLLDFVAPKALP